MVNHIDANEMQYTELNRIIRQKPGEYTLSAVNGQRYIGCGLGSEYKINIHGTPGNDLGAFMDGASVNVFGNCQDATGNTMNFGAVSLIVPSRRSALTTAFSRDSSFSISAACRKESIGIYCTVISSRS